MVVGYVCLSLLTLEKDMKKIDKLIESKNSDGETNRQTNRQADRKTEIPTSP